MQKLSQKQIADNAIHRRAVESAIWGMPLVNFEAMNHVMGGDNRNKFMYWSKLLDWRNQTLTPNPDLIYYMTFIDTKIDGPIVFDIPASDGANILNGNICSAWQVPLEDVGPFGADKGKGGKYLVLPLDYTDEVPDGYFVLRSETYQNYALLRTVLPEGTQEALDAGLKYCEKINIYPLSQASNPPTAERVDMWGKMVDSTIKYDISFYEKLSQMINYENWQTRDKAMMDALKTIGIEKGKDFAPSELTRKILTTAIAEAHEYIRNHFQHELAPFYPSKQWFFPATIDLVKAQATQYAELNYYNVDDRAAIYHAAFIGIKHVGAGQYYLFGVLDKNGNELNAAKTYKLNVPANVPVSQYWSAAMYDGMTHAFVRGNEKYTVSSQTKGLIVNDDGSVDVYFGPKAIAGKEANFIETGDCETFEILFRFYGTQPAIFDQSWQLNDIELIESEQ